MAIYNGQNFIERLTAANKAKKELVEKFNTRPSLDDPLILERKKKRQEVLAARAIREAEKEKKRQEKLALEELMRLKEKEKAAELARLQEEDESRRVAEQLRVEVEQKAKRDARYAARKTRSGRLPPKRA